MAAPSVCRVGKLARQRGSLVRAKGHDQKVMSGARPRPHAPVPASGGPKPLALVGGGRDPHVESGEGRGALGDEEGAMNTGDEVPQSDHDPGHELRELSPEDCRLLLRTSRLGRLAFMVNDQVMILPVNYVFDGASIVVRTAPGLKLDEAPMRTAAFEIGEADPEGSWGWSVVVQGPCFDVSDAIDEPTARLRELPVQPWPSGSRDHWLRVIARTITGRAFGALPAQSPT